MNNKTHWIQNIQHLINAIECNVLSSANPPHLCRFDPKDVNAQNGAVLWFVYSLTQLPNEVDFCRCDRDVITHLDSITIEQHAYGPVINQIFKLLNQSFIEIGPIVWWPVKMLIVKPTCCDAMCKGVNPSPSLSLMIKVPFSESSSCRTVLYRP